MLDTISYRDLKRLTVEIFFIVDGKDYARREWPQVPPVGAHVMMHPVNGPEKYEVTAVLWGVNRDDHNMLTCNVALKKLPKPRRARLKAEKEGKS